MLKEIIVVEDERSLQEAIRIKLEREGFDVKVANSLSKAHECLCQCQNLCAIWLDHYLIGEGCGLDLAQEIKKNNRFCQVPFIVVSNSICHEKINQYMKLGAKKYYTKSEYRLDEIIGDLKGILN